MLKCPYEFSYRRYRRNVLLYSDVLCANTCWREEVVRLE